MERNLSFNMANSNNSNTNSP